MSPPRRFDGPLTGEQIPEASTDPKGAQDNQQAAHVAEMHVGFPSLISKTLGNGSDYSTLVRSLSRGL